MAYLKKFKYDVFFSYAHVDNEENRWVTQFYKTFKFRLDQLLGRSEMASIYFDPALRANYLFDEHIENALCSSAIFIAFTSNGFYASEYCYDVEIPKFYNKAVEDGRIGNVGLILDSKSRIFNVQLFNRHHNDWLPQFRGAGAFKMFERDEFHPDYLGNVLDPKDEKYKDIMNTIVASTYELLVLIKQKNEADTSLPPVKNLVFISKTADTLLSYRNRIIQELKANNIDVLDCKCPPPYDQTQHKQRVRQDLSNCILSLHLFDNVAGVTISDNDPKTFIQEQALIAKEMRKDQLIFIPQDLNFDNIDEKTHNFFLTNLITNKKQDDQYSLIRELSIPSIVDHVKSRLTVQKPHLAQNGSVLLDFHEADLSHAVEWYNKAQIEGNRKIFMAPPGNNPYNGLSNFEEVLKEVKTVVIICVTVAPEWLTERIKEIIRAIRTGRSQISQLSIYRDNRLQNLDLNTLSILN